MPKSRTRKGRKKYAPPKKAVEEAAYPTANAKMIAELLKAKKTKGNFKDFVIFVADKMIDWEGSYQVGFDGEDAKRKPDGPVLMHKRVLDFYIGPELARKFWNPITKMRKVKEGTKPKERSADDGR